MASFSFFTNPVSILLSETGWLAGFLLLEAAVFLLAKKPYVKQKAKGWMLITGVLLIRFFADGQGASAAVKAAGCFPVRDTVDGADLRNIWAGSDVMTEYAKLTDFLSGYDALTPGWATARTEWWNMLQRVGNGGDVVLETDTLVENANAAAKE